MKTILLLAFAVLVSSAPAKIDKNLLGEFIKELNATLNKLPKQPKKETFLKELKTNIYQPELFCQAELELAKKVSGLTKFDDFRTDKQLMRHLNMYNKHHNITCEPIDEDQDEVPLRKFLDNLRKCAMATYSQIKAN